MFDGLMLSAGALWPFELRDAYVLGGRDARRSASGGKGERDMTACHSCTCGLKISLGTYKTLVTKVPKETRLLSWPPDEVIRHPRLASTSTYRRWSPYIPDICD